MGEVLVKGFTLLVFITQLCFRPLSVLAVLEYKAFRLILNQELTLKMYSLWRDDDPK